MVDLAAQYRSGDHITAEARSAMPLDHDIDEALVNGRADTVLQPGKSLVLTDFSPPSLGAGERLIRLAYRLGLPPSTLSSPFSKPARTRLLATVECPLEGERMAGVALRMGHFLVHGVKAPIAQVDFSPRARLTPPFERVIHGFSWLGDLAASAPREECTATAERMLSA